MGKEPEATEKPDTEGLLEQLFARYAKRVRADDDDRGEGTKEDRIRQLTSKVRALEEERATVPDALKKLTAAHAAEMKTLKEGFAGELARFAQGKDHELQLMEKGLSDSDGRALALQAWERAPATTRGKTPAEHWGQLVAAQHAHLADPEKVQPPAVSKALGAYFPAPPEPDKKAATPQGSPGRPAARPPPRGIDAGASRGARSVNDIPATDTMASFFGELAKTDA